MILRYNSIKPPSDRLEIAALWELIDTSKFQYYLLYNKKKRQIRTVHPSENKVTYPLN